MFNDQDLIDHVDKEQALKQEALVFIELNQNDPTNVDTLGVFRTGELKDETVFKQWRPLSSQYYRKKEFITSYMKKDILEEEVVYFGKRPKSDYFNLADCFTEFRPRSGILKAVVPHTKNQVFVDNFRSVNRPRYYVPSIKDEFKYWTSWDKHESTGADIGLSDASTGDINNAAPFIVYKEARPANKVTVKIQTGIGLASKTLKAGQSDPLTDLTRSSIPEKWSVQYLDPAGTWQDIHIFETYDRATLPPETGTVDFAYVVKNPVIGEGLDFVFKGYVPTDKHLPYIARNGDAFGVGADKYNLGEIWVYDGEWLNKGPLERDWEIIDPTRSPENYAVSNYMNPPYYNPTAKGVQDGFNNYREFVMVQGLRIMVTKMFAKSRAFDLIELSPRLFVNISSNVIDYSIDKAIAEDSIMPVGSLSATSGSLSIDNSNLIFNTEQEFNGVTGLGSLMSDRINKNTKVLIYEVVRGVKKDSLIYDYIIPIKTMYAMEKPVVVSGMNEATVNLRDLMFRLEEASCPSLVLKQCSLSKAVATLLDSIGFSNYIFDFPGSDKANTSAVKTIIPYFFVTEDMKIAEALQALATATQSAMFFDEYNNFVVMPREHFGLDPVYTLRGQDIGGRRVNIEEPPNVSVDMVADAEIKYTVRQLARQQLGPNSLNSMAAVNGGRFIPGEYGSFLGYKQSQLWNAGEAEDVTTLSSGVLVSSLSNLIPSYNPQAREAYSNITMDFGFWANNMPFEGMIRMNGEIIKYDAKQVALKSGPVWVTSQQNYDELVGNIGLDQIGQLTGLLRIWTDVEADSAGNLKIVRHGRGMYNTPITTHSAEPVAWLNALPYRHTDSAPNTIFNKDADGYVGMNNYIRKPYPIESSAGTKTTNYIYNPMHSTYSPLDANPTNMVAITEAERLQQLKEALNPVLRNRTVRSSSLVFTGPNGAKPTTVSKKYIQLPGSGYSTYGCRIGIVGIQAVQEDEATGTVSEQSVAGAMPLRVTTTGTGDEAKTETIMGAGGGIFFRTSRFAKNSPGGIQRPWDPTPVPNNDGYYFEITALNGQYDAASDDGSVDEFIFPNVNFYKINWGESKQPYFEIPGQTLHNFAIPLFSAYMPIGVTPGSMFQRNRIFDSNSVVYDLAVDVKQLVLERQAVMQFTLYLNDNIIGVVTDSINSSNGYIPARRDEASEFGFFVRGGSTIQLEHIYAIGADQTQRVSNAMDTNIFRRLPAFKVFSPSAIYTTQELAGGPQNQYRYYEEFGSIGRECKKIEAKFNMFPAFLPRIPPIRTIDRAYTVTHFEADPYKASFMIWSQADDNIIFGDESQLQLVIAGLTFSDNQELSLKLDDYLLGRVPGAAPEDKLNSGLTKRNELLSKRLLGQTSSIDFESVYIQSTDYAKKMMTWLNGFIGEERMRLEVQAFGVPHLQIGDIVSVDYDIPYLAEGEYDPTDDWNPTKGAYAQRTFDFYANDKRFVIRKISVDRTQDGPNYTLSLIEIPSKETWNASAW